MQKTIYLPIALGLFLIFDWYCYGAIKSSFSTSSIKLQKIMQVIYWSISAITLVLILGSFLGDISKIKSTFRNFIITGIFTNFIFKLFIIIFLLIEDITRAIRWTVAFGSRYFKSNMSADSPIDIERAAFLSQTALAVASIPVLAIGYGIVSGAHDYRVKNIKVVLPNLPSAFHGLRIAQVSDIHSGSFFNRTAVKGGVEMIMQQKADVIFFTGDLVNNVATEMNEWINVFEKIKAPMGVYSTLGNHDYGEYVQWESPAAKKRNVQDLVQIHKNMGWDILMNEHRMLKQGGDELAILGIENWGAGERWPKYGKLDLAHRNTDNAAVKLLLSHDPSHWEAQVLPQYKDIDVVFAGHTHGFQFGIEVGSFKWSPVQYVYKQWAGMYTHQHQRIYVNRGFGYIGFPGRIGMPPEITVFELVKQS